MMILDRGLLFGPPCIGYGSWCRFSSAGLRSTYSGIIDYKNLLTFSPSPTATSPPYLFYPKCVWIWIRGNAVCASFVFITDYRESWQSTNAAWFGVP